MKKEFSLEEDVKAQNIVNAIYEILEKHGLEEICVWDEDTQSLKDVESMCLNGSILQMNVE